MSRQIPKTLFVYKRGGIDTAEIRGKQVASELGCDLIPLSELTADAASRYDAVVYVKRIPGSRLMDRIRQLGVMQVMDVLDNYSRWTLRRGARYLNAFIGANLTQSCIFS